MWIINRKRKIYLVIAALLIAAFATGISVFYKAGNKNAGDNTGGEDQMENTVLENVALGKPYTLSPVPDYAACKDEGDAIQLTDGKYTSGFFWAQKSTVGWNAGRPIIITIDLGKVEPVCGVSYSTAAGPGQKVEWPEIIRILVSEDGKEVYDQGDLVVLSRKNGEPPSEGYGVCHRYRTDELKTYGRYIQLVIVTPNLLYCFTDEVEIYKGEPQWLSQKLKGDKISGSETTPGGKEYFDKFIVNYKVRNRLHLEVQEAKKAVQSSTLAGRDIKRLLNEASRLEKNIDDLSCIDPADYDVILPMNELEDKIFALRAKLRSQEGQPGLKAWVGNPYDVLSPAGGADEKARSAVDVFMMNNECRYAVVNLTSSLEKLVSVTIHIDGLPGGINPDYLTVYRAEWTDTITNEPIASALIKIEPNEKEYEVSVPAGMTRQVWLSFKPYDIPAGDYSGYVTISGNDTVYKNELTVPLNMKIYPFTFPEQTTLHLGGHDYLNTSSISEDLRKRLADFFHEYRIDSAWSQSAAMPMGTFDSSGNMSPVSTAYFDKFVELWPDAGRYSVYITSSLINKADINSPVFNMRIKSWIDYWVNYAKSKGIEPGQLNLLICDESLTNATHNIVISAANVIKSAQPGVRIWQNRIFPTVTSQESEDILEKLLNLIDILSLNRNRYMNNGQKYSDVLKKDKLEFYSCLEEMELMDPYTYLRLQAWTCWDTGATGFTFWSLTDNGRGNLWKPYNTLATSNYAPVFLTDSGFVSGKQMEALRESAEDYEYFNMLKMAKDNADPGNPAVQKAEKLLTAGIHGVLEAEGTNIMLWHDSIVDKWAADEIRREILDTMIELKRTP